MTPMSTVRDSEEQNTCCRELPQCEFHKIIGSTVEQTRELNPGEDRGDWMSACRCPKGWIGRDIEKGLGIRRFEGWN